MPVYALVTPLYAMDRARLTITLKPDLLGQVDRTVDGARVRNRSHAIELLLEKAIVVDTVPVLVLAGGKLVRNGSDEIPKALIEVQGAPVLSHMLKRLGNQGFSEVVVSSNEVGMRKIKEWLYAHARDELTLKFDEQPKGVSGTAAAVRSASPMMGRATFIVQYGDVLADIDYNELLQFHKVQRGFVTVALTSVEHTSMWGVATMQGAHIVDFTEKPKPTAGKLSHLVNAGMYVMEPSAISLIPAGSGSIEQTLFPRLAQEGRLYGYPFEGEWRDVGRSG